MKGIWHALFRYPCTNVLLPLLESSEPKEFNEFLEHLHNQMVRSEISINVGNLEIFDLIVGRDSIKCTRK